MFTKIFCHLSNLGNLANSKSRKSHKYTKTKQIPLKISKKGKGVENPVGNLFLGISLFLSFCLLAFVLSFVHFNSLHFSQFLAKKMVLVTHLFWSYFLNPIVSTYPGSNPLQKLSLAHKQPFLFTPHNPSSSQKRKSIFHPKIQTQFSPRFFSYVWIRVKSCNLTCFAFSQTNPRTFNVPEGIIIPELGYQMR